MALDIVQTLVQLVIMIVVMVILIAPALWLAGRLLAGKGKAKFTDALWIVVIGTIVWYFFNLFIGMYVGGLIPILLSYLLLLIIWLALVKHFFDCGWLKALAISIIAIVFAIIIWFIIFFILALIGISTGWLPTPVPTAVPI